MTTVPNNGINRNHKNLHTIIETYNIINLSYLSKYAFPVLPQKHAYYGK